MASGYELNDTQRGRSEHNHDTAHNIYFIGHKPMSFQTPYGETIRRSGGNTGNTTDEVEQLEEECQECREETGTSQTAAEMQLRDLITCRPLIIKLQQGLQKEKEYSEKLEKERYKQHQRTRHLMGIIKQSNERRDGLKRQNDELKREKDELRRERDETKRENEELKEQVEDLMLHLDRQNDPEIRGGDIYIGVRERRQ